MMSGPLWFNSKKDLITFIEEEWDENFSIKISKGLLQYKVEKE